MVRTSIHACPDSSLSAEQRTDRGGDVEPRGRRRLDIPSSTATALAIRPDVPFDTPSMRRSFGGPVRPLYPALRRYLFLSPDAAGAGVRRADRPWAYRRSLHVLPRLRCFSGSRCLHRDRLWSCAPETALPTAS